MTRPEFSEILYGSAAYEASVALRDAVLRRPLGLGFSHDELDRERTDHHLACHVGGELVGCLILVPKAGGEIKMRQVAVAPHARGRGFGRALVRFAEDFARERSFTVMTLHARESAVAFYERLGYERAGERFEEVSVPHWRMRKAL